MSWIPISNQGIPGPAGPTGPQGTAGTSINLKGEVATQSALPTVGNQINDGYITVDTGDLWVWTSSLTWANAGTIVGPQGPTGPQGIQGIQGPQGPPGTNGVTSLNTLVGALNIVAGSGITVTPSGTDITITNTDILPISNRTSSTSSITIGTGFVTLLSNTIVTTAPNYDIDIWGTINYTFVHTSGGTNAIVRVLFDGTPIGINQTISLDNNNTFGQVSIIASQLSASAGSHTITLQMQKSAANGTLTHVNSQLIVIGNIQ